MNKIGTMFYNKNNGRMDIKFKDGSIYDGLHCGECFEVKIKGRYIPTRIEKSSDWYLCETGLRGIDSLVGLNVRIY
jgi:hypothetical protein